MTRSAPQAVSELISEVQVSAVLTGALSGRSVERKRATWSMVEGLCGWRDMSEIEKEKRKRKICFRVLKKNPSCMHGLMRDDESHCCSTI
jgi:hypothetical protein